MGDARQIFLSAEQTQVTQLNPCQPCLEIFLDAEDEIELCLADVRLIVADIRKFCRAASVHLSWLRRQRKPTVGSQAQSSPSDTAAWPSMRIRNLYEKHRYLVQKTRSARAQ